VELIPFLKMGSICACLIRYDGLAFCLNEKIEAPAICWTGASSCHVVDVGGDGELTTRHCCINAAILAAVPIIS